MKLIVILIIAYAVYYFFFKNKSGAGSAAAGQKNELIDYRAGGSKRTEFTSESEMQMMSQGLKIKNLLDNLLASWSSSLVKVALNNDNNIISDMEQQTGTKFGYLEIEHTARDFLIHITMNSSGGPVTQTLTYSYEEPTKDANCTVDDAARLAHIREMAITRIADGCPNAWKVGSRFYMRRP